MHRGPQKYDGKTFGVVALQGESQAKLITQMLLEQLNPAEIEKRRLICGSPYSFQGDQRHIMFISMIIAISDDRRKPAALVTDMFKKRLNVAASRSPVQVFLFHSIRIKELQPRLLRRRLLEHYYSRPTSGPIAGCGEPRCPCQDCFAGRSQGRPAARELSTVGSRSMFTCIFRTKGYRVIEQFPINEYRIDMVIEGAKNKLALECDGDYLAWPRAVGGRQDTPADAGALRVEVLPPP